MGAVMECKGAVWQRYEVDPLDLIGRTVSIRVVRRGARLRRVSGGWCGRSVSCEQWAGVVRSVYEDRGKSVVDEPGDNWAEDALDTVEEDTWPKVVIWLRGCGRIEFDPEKDAVSITWLQEKREA